MDRGNWWDEVQHGARKNSLYYPVQRFKKWLKGFIPEGGGGVQLDEGPDDGKNLAGKIGDIRRMVTDPQPDDSIENVYREFMATGEGLDTLDNESLKALYDELRDYEGQSRYEMIEDLMKYRKRFYSR